MHNVNAICYKFWLMRTRIFVILLFILFIVVRFLQKKLSHEFHFQLYFHSDFIVLSRLCTFYFHFFSVQKVSLASCGEECNYFGIFTVYLMYVYSCAEVILTVVNHLMCAYLTKAKAVIRNSNTDLFYLILHIRIYRNNWAFSRNVKYFFNVDTLLR